MKRPMPTVTAALLVLSLMDATVFAQQRSPNPQGQRQSPQDTLPPGLQAVPPDGRFFQGRVLTERTLTAMRGAWWTNNALVARLGLSDDQKSKIEKAFENHRQAIVTSTAGLEKEEAQLARLLGAETIDRNAVLSQIDRVMQARNEMERESSVMTLEMREYLTRAQWSQLQALQPSFSVGYYAPALRAVPGQRFGVRGGEPAPPTTETPPATGERRGGRGGRGQQ